MRFISLSTPQMGKFGSNLAALLRHARTKISKPPSPPWSSSTRRNLSSRASLSLARITYHPSVPDRALVGQHHGRTSWIIQYSIVNKTMQSQALGTDPGLPLNVDYCLVSVQAMGRGRRISVRVPLEHWMILDWLGRTSAAQRHGEATLSRPDAQQLAQPRPPLVGQRLPVHEHHRRGHVPHGSVAWYLSRWVIPSSPSGTSTILRCRRFSSQATKTRPREPPRLRRHRRGSR
jgi:hypothetical protein